MEFNDVVELAVFTFKREDAYEHFISIIIKNEIDYGLGPEALTVRLDTVGADDPFVINDRYSVQEMYDYVQDLHNPKHVQTFLNKVFNNKHLGKIVGALVTITIILGILRFAPVVITEVRETALNAAKQELVERVVPDILRVGMRDIAEPEADKNPLFELTKKITATPESAAESRSLRNLFAKPIVVPEATTQRNQMPVRIIGAVFAALFIGLITAMGLMYRNLM